MKIIVCDNCDKEMTSPSVVGLTIICPYCKKSVNRQYYDDFIRKKTENNGMMLK